MISKKLCRIPPQPLGLTTTFLNEEIEQVVVRLKDTDLLTLLFKRTFIDQSDFNSELRTSSQCQAIKKLSE
jgi:hypothetical protein